MSKPHERMLRELRRVRDRAREFETSADFDPESVDQATSAKRRVKSLAESIQAQLDALEDAAKMCPRCGQGGECCCP